MASAEVETLLKYTPWLIAGCSLVFALWEMFRPRTASQGPLAKRWGIHFSLSLVASFLHHLLPGLGSLVLVAWARSGPFGLLNHLGIPVSLQALVTIPAFDLVAYWRHRLMHAVSVGWKIHLLHHSDRDMDFTNAFRFHPLELVFTMLIQSCAVLILAPPSAGVVLASLCFSVSTLYEHANITLPLGAERLLRLVFITPALHRIHHLQEETAQQSNFGDIFVFWDRLFGTYQAESPAFGSAIGLKEVSLENSTRVGHILGAPFGS